MKTINFKIIYNKNDDIYQYGYVEIPDDVEELPDWFYYDQNGFAQPRAFTNHDSIGLTQIGATTEQLNELDLFYKALNDEVDFIDDTILTADEDENRTYVRGNLTLIINDGAKMECTINEDIEKDSWSQYIVELIPKFNGVEIDLAGFMNEKNIIFDPYGVGDDDANFSIENGHIYFEISKDWFEGDEKDKEDNLRMFINPEAEDIYKQYLTSELGVYGIASVIYQEKHGKLDESTCDKFASRWEQAFEDMPVNELYAMSEEDVERIMEEEGY